MQEGRAPTFLFLCNLFKQPLHLRVVVLFFFCLTIYLGGRWEPGGSNIYPAKRILVRRYLSSQLGIIYLPDMSVRMLSAANNRTFSSTALNNKGNSWAQFLKSLVTQTI